jgi:ferredoxin
MLRKLRVTAAALCLTGFCLLFADASGILPPKLAVLAQAQLIPALLSGSVAVFAALVAITLIFGRIYCSVLCPLGVLQDAISRTGKGRFRFAPAATRLRLGALALFVFALCAGIPFLFALLEPYSIFGRMAADILAPLWQSAGNVLALASERAGNFAVGPTPVWQKGPPALVAALLTLAVIGALARKTGRTWCNTLCPAGTVLGFLGRFSLLKPRIDAAACVHCGRCAEACKASCIDAGNGELDASRCVACFNCLEKCRRGAIRYGAKISASPAKEGEARPDPADPADPGRRGFLAAALSLGGLPPHAARRDLAAEEKIPALTRKERPKRDVPVTPPGSHGLRAFMERCTGCQLCVSACPNQVLSAFGLGTGMFQPALSFERGFCRVNCVTCSVVCPTGAITPIDAAEKSVTQIGRAVLDPERCINSAEEEKCVACVRNCPPGALTLIEGQDGSRRIAVDTERCTGCGACEYLCPVRPLSAVWVEGNREHRRI